MKVELQGAMLEEIGFVSVLANVYICRRAFVQHRSYVVCAPGTNYNMRERNVQHPSPLCFLRSSRHYFGGQGAPILSVSGLEPRQRRETKRMYFDSRKLADYEKILITYNIITNCLALLIAPLSYKC